MSMWRPSYKFAATEYQKGSPPSPPFSPLDISGLALWLDASDAGSFTYGTGDNVSQWNDLSGNNRHFSQGTASKQPNRSTTQNGLSVVSFDKSTQDTMTAPVYAASRTAFSIFCVAAPTATNIHAHFMLGSDNNAGIAHRTETGSTYGGLLGGVAWVRTSLAGDTSGYSLQAFRRGSGTNTVRRNSVDLTVTAGGSSTPSAASGSMWLASDSKTKYASVDIAEILVYDGVTLTGSDLSQVESYLNNKWAVF